jgi:hypothetical protein
LKYRAKDQEIKKFQEIPFTATTHIVVLPNNCIEGTGKMKFTV